MNPMSKETERVTVYLSKDSFKWMEQTRAYLGLSKSAVMDLLVRKYGPTLKRGVQGLSDDGHAE